MPELLFGPFYAFLRSQGIKFHVVTTEGTPGRSEAVIGVFSSGVVLFCMSEHSRHYR